MILAFKVGMKQKVDRADISTTISRIYQILTQMLTTLKQCCSTEMLTKIIEETLKQLTESPKTGEPVQDILNAAKSALKPMRIHNLIVENVSNSLENLRSVSIQLIQTIHSISENVIFHRKAVEILCCIRNIISLNKIFLSELATLFELEKSGLLVKQQTKQASDAKEDLNIWNFTSVDTSQWPEQSGTLNSLVLQLTSVESFGKLKKR